MKLTQLINHVGDEVGVQFLNQCITDVKSTKTMGTKVTFATDAITPNDIARNVGVIGLVVWIPRDKWPSQEQIQKFSANQES